MVKKSDLRHGMMVRNTRSNNIGEIRGDEDGGLYGADWCVSVRVRNRSGKKIGIYEYAHWNLDNLEIV